MARKKPPTPDCAKRFYRVAAQRLPEARWVLTASDGAYTTLAVYVGGYAVECALKAVLLARTPKTRHARVKDDFRGKVGHNFDSLRAHLVACGVTIPVEVSRQLAKVNWWTTDLRYEPSRLNFATAEAFLSAAEVVVEWSKRSL